MVPGRHRSSVITPGLAIVLAVLAGSVSAGTPPCTYSISPPVVIYDSPAATGSFQVTTNDPICPWYAYNNTTWIAITNGDNHTGSGPLEYAISENDTPHQRLATILVIGADGFDQHLTIVQNHPWIPVNFDFDIFSPEIGETVTFTTDPRLEVQSWSFTSPDCNGRLPTVFCSGIAGECNEIRWTWKHPGPKEITMETTTGNQTKILTVRDTGQCPEACGGVGPDDGTVENGYGWGTSNLIVQRFTPESYPFSVTDVCVALTQAAADTSIRLTLVVYDDDGPLGRPQSMLGTSTTDIDGVPGWLDHSFYPMHLPAGGVSIDKGSVYIGVMWDDMVEVGFYVAADESPETPVQAGFYKDDSNSWQRISSAFPSYRSLLLRTAGYPASDGEWRMVVGSDLGGGNGFGIRDNAAVTSMAPFDGGLFAGTANRHGAEVNATTDGEEWWLVSDPGFGDPTNLEISTLISFEDHLYASTGNPTLGAEIWRTGTPVNWSIVEGSGLGDPANASAPSGAAFAGFLYLGTDNFSGCEIWRSPDGETWTQVNLNGFGDPYNQVATAMTVYDGALFAGTLNSNGAEVWRSPDGIIWDPVVTGGFGSAPNVAINDFSVFRGALYAGMSNPVTGAQIWRSADGSTWDQVIGDGFGDSGLGVFDAFASGNLGLYASVSGPTGPGVIWQSIDGTTWAPSSSPGFTDPTNTAIGELRLWDGRVYAGSSNQASGCEVWRGGRHTLFDDDFESGDTTNWTAVAP